MDCPHCSSRQTKERPKKTVHGYQIYFCLSCRRQFNERTNSPFNRRQYSTQFVFTVLIWRLRYKLSLRDLCEMWLTRGIVITHETIRQWEVEFAPLLSAELKKNRRGRANARWKVDETKVKVGKEWQYLYRAIDSDGKLVDTRLSKVRNLAATEAFFRQAVETVGKKPTQVTTDKEVSYPGAIEKVAGKKIEHRTVKCLNNKLEQNHRGIKQRYAAMLGFKNDAGAERFSQAFDEQRNYFRYRLWHKHKVTTPLQRLHVTGKFHELETWFVNKKQIWKQGLLTLDFG